MGRLNSVIVDPFEATPCWVELFVHSAHTFLKHVLQLYALFVNPQEKSDWIESE